QPANSLLVGNGLSRQGLDRHARSVRIFSQIDNSHPTPAQFAEEPVSTQLDRLESIGDERGPRAVDDPGAPTSGGGLGGSQSFGVWYGVNRVRVAQICGHDGLLVKCSRCRFSETARALARPSVWGPPATRHRNPPL